MARETTTALTCDRCGHLQRFSPNLLANDGMVRPEPWGWVMFQGQNALDLCAGCLTALEWFMLNNTVQPGPRIATALTDNAAHQAEMNGETND